MTEPKIAEDETDSRVPGGATSRQRLFAAPLLLGLLGLLALTVSSLLARVYDVLGSPDGAYIFALTRIPRIVSLLLTSPAMAISGLVVQQISQNRFVEPTTTGTTEWAGLGLLCVLILCPEAPLMVKMVIAITAILGGTMVLFLVLRHIQLRSAMIVPIVGIMLGVVVGAVSFCLAQATSMLQTLGIWLQSSFSAAIQGQYELVWVAVIMIIGVLLVANQFTIAGLGKDTATNVRIDHRKIVLLGTGTIAAVTGTITVVTGNLPFLGLVVLNIVSLLRGDNLRSNLPWVCLTGAAMVMACDTVGRLVTMPSEVPVDTILSVVGAFVFASLLLKRRGNA